MFLFCLYQSVEGSLQVLKIHRSILRSRQSRVTRTVTAGGPQGRGVWDGAYDTQPTLLKLNAQDTIETKLSATQQQPRITPTNYFLACPKQYSIYVACNKAPVLS